ncbi:hypothetical protein EJV47_09250 [Hymenobacter gummosus]|uniref:Uncharacterized protein n=1 Tax=Hymenobacter gummosus TaxID=1776032 RepID=A0A431U4L9_9BACT|nr:hypothetical protein [Hymenobacter gummosus]RTQ50796.1 hypothetical protein EJV47_09250 [Hymenobacter gummosus]
MAWPQMASSAQQAPYRVVVADARTRAALPAATVQADGRTLRPDAAGRLSLPARPQRLQLSHVGYQSRLWQPAPAADTLWLTPQATALPGVQVRAQPRAVLWRYAGKSRWPQDAFVQGLIPGQQVAVHYRPADSTRQYRIRAVRVRLGQRFPEGPAGMFTDRRQFPKGQLRVHLALPGPDGAPTADFAAQSWLITPAQSEGHDNGWLRLPCDAELLVPAGGLFVVATSLSSPDETALRARMLEYRKGHPETGTDFNSKEPKRKGTTLNQFVEVQPAGGPTRLVPAEDYPAVAQRTAPNEAGGHSWQYRSRRWQSQQAYYAEMRQRFPHSDYSPANYELVLEVEEL